MQKARQQIVNVTDISRTRFANVNVEGKMILCHKTHRNKWQKAEPNRPFSPAIAEHLRETDTHKRQDNCNSAISGQ
jgi:hypothetical protein